MRLFLDANILFLAGYSMTSPVHDLLALARIGTGELVTSSYALEEARRNLARKGPAGWDSALDRALEVISVVAEADAPSRDRARDAGLADPDDVPILAAAIHCRAARLVTGDRRAFDPHFGQHLGGVRISTLREALVERLAEG